MSRRTIHRCHALTDPSKDQRCFASIPHSHKICCEAHEDELNESYAEYKTASHRANNLRFFAQLKRSEVSGLNPTMVDFHIEGLRDYVEALEREIQLRSEHAARFFVKIDEGHRQRLKKLERDLGNTKRLQRDLADRKRRLESRSAARGRAKTVGSRSEPHTRASSHVSKRRRRRDRRKHSKRQTASDESRVGASTTIEPESESKPRLHFDEGYERQRQAEKRVVLEEQPDYHRQLDQQLWRSWIDLHVQRAEQQAQRSEAHAVRQRDGLREDEDAMMGASETEPTVRQQWEDAYPAEPLGEAQGYDLDTENVSGGDGEPILLSSSDKRMEAASPEQWEGSHLGSIALSPEEEAFDAAQSVDRGDSASALLTQRYLSAGAFYARWDTTVTSRSNEDVSPACIDVCSEDHVVGPTGGNKGLGDNDDQDVLFNTTFVSHETSLPTAYTCGSSIVSGKGEGGASLNDHVSGRSSPVAVKEEMEYYAHQMLPSSPSLQFTRAGAHSVLLPLRAPVPPLDPSPAGLRNADEASGAHDVDSEISWSAADVTTVELALSLPENAIDKVEASDKAEVIDQPSEGQETTCTEALAETGAEIDSHENGHKNGEIEPSVGYDADERGDMGEEAEAQLSPEFIEDDPDDLATPTQESMPVITERNPEAVHPEQVVYVAKTGRAPVKAKDYGSIPRPQSQPRPWDVDVEGQRESSDDAEDHPDPHRGQDIRRARAAIAGTILASRISTFRSPILSAFVAGCRRLL
ncbi:hypothetical protein BN946_scf184844.g60 [Trametes cinnabarina]|uniref:Uncharacterized protein n=1 Tax=Pycnoporus cinnabarinus TaxID=5643 RepID=A0A060S9Z1_PYCCI|nr:hypothetical protein BN946_scf184844.g60 [Trametes cinnabarina]